MVLTVFPSMITCDLENFWDFFIFTHISAPCFFPFLVLWALFFHGFLSIWWTVFFCIFCVSRLVVTSYHFPSPDNFFIFPSCSKDSFVGYRIPSWCFVFSAWKILCCSFLDSMASDEKDYHSKCVIERQGDGEGDRETDILTHERDREILLSAGLLSQRQSDTEWFWTQIPSPNACNSQG